MTTYLDLLDSDELAHVPALLAELGLNIRPTIRRVSLTPEVSALAWGDGPADVVLLHGAALNAHTWDTTLLQWYAESGRSFLALDLPGHGDSPWRDDADYRPATIAQPVAESLAAARTAGLLADLPLAVGHSLGGLVALEMTEVFRRVALVDILPLPPEVAGTVASFLDGPSSFSSREEIVERAVAFGLGGGRERAARGVALNTRVRTDGRVVWKHHFGVLGGAGLRVRDTDETWRLVEGSATPLDLVAATASFIDAATLDAFLRRRPGARATRVAGGHNLQEDAPVPLAHALADLS